MGRSANTDPLEKFRFLVDFLLPDGTSPARTGFHDVQMPKRATSKIAYREGHNPDISSQSAGLSTFEDVVFSNGVLAGGAEADDMYKWMQQVHGPTAGIVGYGGPADGSASQSTSSNTYRAEVTIKMLDREGTTVKAWRLYNAWPTNFVPGSDLNAAEDGDKSMQALTLCYEDFQELTVTAGVVSSTAL